MGRDAVLGPVLERYWLVSTGVAVYAPSNYALYFNYTENIKPQSGSLNRQFCLKTDTEGTLHSKSSPTRRSLDYTICVGDLNTVHNFSINQLLGNQSSNNLKRPSAELFEKPTWSVLSDKSSQQAILDYAVRISNGNFSHSHILIPNWEQYLGDLTFDQERFPDPTAMFEQLKTLGFTPVLVVTPYVSIMSERFQEAVNGDQLILDASGQVPGLVMVQLGKILTNIWDLISNIQINKKKLWY